MAKQREAVIGILFFMGIALSGILTIRYTSPAWKYASGVRVKIGDQIGTVVEAPVLIGGDGRALVRIGDKELRIPVKAMRLNG